MSEGPVTYHCTMTLASPTAAEPAEAALTDGVLLELLAIRAIAKRVAQRPAGPPAAYQRALVRIAHIAGLAMDRLLVEAV